MSWPELIGWDPARGESWSATRPGQRLTIGPTEGGGLMFGVGAQLVVLSDIAITEGRASALAEWVAGEIERTGSAGFALLPIFYHAILDRCDWLKREGGRE